jgi:preprotein translocase subunit SecA
MALASGDPYQGAPMPTRVSAGPLRVGAVDPNDPSTWAATPRNAPCPCGSGKKFKHCHGRTM